jgi:hypothetical protein
MVLLNSLPNQDILLTIDKPLTLWIGTHEAIVKVRGKKLNHVIFSPITADRNSEILVDKNKQIFWRNQFSALGWFPARIYNISLNPSRYATVSPDHDESTLWRVMPFEYCLSNGLISQKKRPAYHEAVFAKKTMMTPHQYERLMESADLLTTPNAPQELQWLKESKFV